MKGDAPAAGNDPEGTEAVGATPFGFGMRLKAVECPTSDLAHYTAGYEALLALSSNTGTH